MGYDPAPGVHRQLNVTSGLSVAFSQAVVAADVDGATKLPALFLTEA